MREKRCFFMGHREASDMLFAALYNEVERHIAQCGVTEFFVGGYGGFDRLAAKAVCKAKKMYPNVKLLLLLPYHPAERMVKLPLGFDGSVYPSGMEHVPGKAAIVKANRIMIDECDYLIAYAWHPASNARELVEYARRRETRGLISVVNLAEKEERILH